MFSKSLMKQFKGFGSGYAGLHFKLDADTLLDFTVHLRMKHRVKKALNLPSDFRGTPVDLSHNSSVLHHTS
jgi:hypothetical protein